MTAIFGFTDRKSGAAFLGADDLEAISRSRMDKLVLLDGRFCVGVFGQETPMGVLDRLLVREQFSAHQPFASADALADAILAGLRASAGRTYGLLIREEKKGNVTEERWDALHKSSANVVVLDLDLLELTAYELGTAFPPAGLAVQPKRDPRQDGIVHGFAAGAHSALDGQRVALIPALLTKPETVVGPEIDRLSRSFSKAVGQFGAFAANYGGRTRFVSRFASVTDAINAEADVVGVQIVVQTIPLCCRLSARVREWISSRRR